MFEVPMSSLSAKGALIDTDGTSPEDIYALTLIATSAATAATTSAVLYIPNVPLVKLVLLLIATEAGVDA
jgi:hypothetical protein